MLRALLPDSQLDVGLPERRLQLLDLLEPLPLPHVWTRLAVLRQALLATLQEEALRDRPLASLTTTSGLSD